MAECFARGSSHKQVARQLGVSPHTVRCQLAGVYRKLQVHDKATLARRFGLWRDCEGSDATGRALSPDHA